MTQAKAGFSERAVNKFIALILSRLVNAEQLQVQIKTTFKQLARGEINGLNIQMSNYLLRSHLRVETFNFEIGPAAVNLQRIRQRKIELLHPSEGTLHLSITESQLTHWFNAILLNPAEPESRQLQSIHCELREGAIALCTQGLDQSNQITVTHHVVPTITGESCTVTRMTTESANDSLPDEWAQRAIAALTNIFNLNDIANRGTTFQIQQILITPGTVTIRAIAHIEQFPTTPA